jgi:hypothetical protein
MRRGPASDYDKWNISVVVCDIDNLYHIMLYRHEQDSNLKNVSGDMH